MSSVKPKFIGILFVLLSCLMWIIPTPSYASPLPPEKGKELRKILTYYAVSDTEQDQLLSKLQQGIPWDSINGAKPVKSEQRIVGDLQESIQRYADGSVVFTRVPAVVTSPSGIQPRSNSDNMCSGGSANGGYYVTYENCKAEVGNILLSMSIRFNFTAYPDGPSNIGDYWDETCGGFLTSCSNTNVTRPSQNRIILASDVYSGVSGDFFGINLNIGSTQRLRFEVIIEGKNINTSAY